MYTSLNFSSVCSDHPGVQDNDEHLGKMMNTLENYYIQFCYQHNVVIKEQTQK